MFMSRANPLLEQQTHMQLPAGTVPPLAREAFQVLYNLIATLGLPQKPASRSLPHLISATQLLRPKPLLAFLTHPLSSLLADAPGSTLIPHPESKPGPRGCSYYPGPSRVLSAEASRMAPAGLLRPHSAAHSPSSTHQPEGACKNGDQIISPPVYKPSVALIAKPNRISRPS